MQDNITKTNDKMSKASDISKNNDELNCNNHINAYVHPELSTNILTKDILKIRQTKLATKNINISCIVPVLNEEENIKKFISHLLEKLKSLTNKFEIIIVDDGSTDNTSFIVEELTQQNNSIKLIKLSRNFGKETALSAGLEHCLCDVAILIDADFQHPLNLIDEFINKWTLGYNMVYGVRKDRKDETIIKRAFTKVFYKLMIATSNMEMVADAGDFRLLDISVINALNSCEERTRFMKGLYAWVGHKSIGIPFNVEKRESGSSSWNFFKLTELAITGITSFSNLPLRVWSFFGLAISLISLLCVAFIIVKTLIIGIDVPGYASLIVTIVFFGGIQLFSIGILGEYISRIFHEVKRRPKYIIEKKLGFNK